LWSLQAQTRCNWQGPDRQTNQARRPRHYMQQQQADENRRKNLD
jgi:hypothetical protein